MRNTKCSNVIMSYHLPKCTASLNHLRSMWLSGTDGCLSPLQTHLGTWKHRSWLLCTQNLYFPPKVLPSFLPESLLEFWFCGRWEKTVGPQKSCRLWFLKSWLLSVFLATVLCNFLFVQQNPAKQGSGSSGNGGSGEKAERNKKRVRQPGSTADRQRAKVVGQVRKRYVC